MPELQNVKRCPAEHNGQQCNSAVFYDWGLRINSEIGTFQTPTGPDTRFTDSAQIDHVQICARCSTPYIIASGQLVSIAGELSEEDVKLILSRGQASLPHPAIKDP